MRIIPALLLLGFCSSSFALTQKITNFKQLLTSLEQGDDVSAIIHMDDCRTKAGLSNPLAGASTRFNFNVFSHYKIVDAGVEKETIATSVTVFTEHRDYGPVYAYGRVRVFTNNQLEIHIAYYQVENYEARGSLDLTCHLGEDAQSVAVFAKN